MTDRSSLEVPEALRQVGDRIQQWRESRPHLCAMPADLGAEAAKVARAHGVYAVARALHLSDSSLNEKVAGRPKGARTRRRNQTPRFVELRPTAPVFSAVPGDTVIEMTNRAGDKLAIRLPAQAQFDAGGLALAFLGQRS